MFNYVLLAGAFRKFWEGLRNGDRIVQEKIAFDFLGVFYLLRKSKYFQITLEQIEREYGEIDFKNLEEIRLNMAFKYECPSDIVDEKNKGLKVLDEVQENINLYMKKLPLGTTIASWKKHSPNVMCAHQAINFEKHEHIKHRINYESIENNDEEITSSYLASQNTSIPRQNVERFRLYEFCVKMFHNKPTTNHVDEACVKKIIDNLETSLKVQQDNGAVQQDNGTTESKDALDKCIDELFDDDYLLTIMEEDCEEDVDNELEATDHSDEGDDCEMMENNNNNEEESANESGIGNTNEPRNDASKQSKVHPLSLINVIKFGEDKLRGIDVLQIRNSSKKRLNRFEKLQQEMHEDVMKTENDLRKKLKNFGSNQNKSNDAFALPMFRRKYRCLLRN